MLNRLKKNFMQTSTCQLQDFAGDQKCPQVLKLNVSNQMQEMLVVRRELMVETKLRVHALDKETFYGKVDDFDILPS